MAGSEKWGLAFVVILLVAVIVAAVLMKCGRISSLALIALIFVALVLFPVLLGICWHVAAPKCVTIFLMEIFISILFLSIWGLRKEGDGIPRTHFHQ